VTRAIEPLTRLGLRFVFPAFGPDYEKPRTVDCEAVVIRCEPAPGRARHFRLGACFTRMSPSDRRYISEYVAWHREVYGDYGPTGGAAETGEAAA
jgi:hypothetical protein